MVMVPVLDDIESVGGEERDVLIDDGPQRAQVVQEGNEHVANGLQDSKHFPSDGFTVGLLEQVVHGPEAENGVEAVLGEL